MKIVDGLKLAALTLATPSEDMIVDLRIMTASFAAAGVAVCMGQTGVAGAFGLLGVLDFLKMGSFATTALCAPEETEKCFEWRKKKTPFNVVRALIQDREGSGIYDVSIAEMRPYAAIIGRLLRSDHYAGVASHLLENMAHEEASLINPAIPDMMNFLYYGDTLARRTNGEKNNEKMGMARQNILYALACKAGADPAFLGKIQKDLRKTVDRTACPYVLDFYTRHYKPQTTGDVKWLVGLLDNRHTQAEAAWALKDVAADKPTLLEGFRKEIGAKTACYNEPGRPYALYQLRDGMQKAGIPASVAA